MRANLGPLSLLAYGMRYPFHTVDVFTDRPFGGNPLAVLPDARDLSTQQMQSVAREFNYSESTFVLPPEDPAHDFQVRIFTPGSELPFAGHPTIGTAFVLALAGEIEPNGAERDVVFGEGAGAVAVRVLWADGRPLAAQLTAPQRYRESTVDLSVDTIASCLSLEAEEIALGANRPVVISCGLPFLLVPIRSLESIQRARLRMSAWEDHLATREATRHVYLYAPHALGESVDGHVRLFAPGEGVPEDPATGSAATALAGFLASRRHEPDGTFRWRIEQGLEIGRPSRLEIEAEKRAGIVATLRCQGGCVAVTEGMIEIPD
jgi:trans-2,3-dihydro-3-hydroxyanthranilate isomerase